MKKTKKILICFILLLLFIFTPVINNVVEAENGSNSPTYTTDSSGKIINTQDAYIPIKTIISLNVVNSDNDTIKTPEDIYYDEVNGYFYLADTLNQRILRINQSFTEAIEIGFGTLIKPTGIFTTMDGTIYVADYGLKAIVKYIFNSSNDTYESEIISKPNHPLYGNNTEFLPTKIVVDSAGTMYTVDAGNSNGLVTITKNGDFSGYFGANYASPSLSFIIKFMFSTKEQRKRLYVSPIAPRNVTIDGEGLINTISAFEGSAIKKLNIAGANMLPTSMIDETGFVDIAIGNFDNIYTISNTGSIYEYSKDGDLLFIFGGSDATKLYAGLFADPKAIEVDNNSNIYILDKNTIQVFMPTEFASLVHEALGLYQQGLYTMSREPWQQVLKMNNMFDLAHKGLGNAYLHDPNTSNNYKLALEEFKLAKDTNGYSEAFWEIRNVWIDSYGTYIFLSLAILILLLFILSKVHVFDPLKVRLKRLKEKIMKNKFIREFCYMKEFIFHPLNGFYEIKYHNTMSVGVATIYYVILFIIIILAECFTGFVFNTGDIENISLTKTFSLTMLPILLFVVANYLISSITEGSGKLKHVYIGTICSLAPIIFFYPIIIIISNVIINSESFLFTMPQLIVFGWSAVLLYFMIKDVQDLRFGEANKNVILTILTMILIVAFGFLIYILGAQLVSFLKEVFIEVIAHG